MVIDLATQIKCDVEQLVADNRALKTEVAYWKGQVELCMQAAYPPSHAPERPYDPNVMAYPDRRGCTTPSTLVSAVIDGLRDAVQDGFFKAKLGVVAELEAKLRTLKAHGVEIVDAADGGYEVHNEAARERDEMRGKLSKALGYAHDILALMD